MYPVSDDCDGDGNRRNDRLIVQRIFGDTDGSGEFTRTDDQVAWEKDVGCSVFHHQHRHWHMESFSRYELREVVSPFAAVAVSAKVSFCVIDTDLYDAVSANGNNAYYTQCGRNVDLGLSVGWADVYGYWLDGQSIDVTSTPNGQYCLVSTADPDNGIEEIDDTNNIASVLVTIDGNQVTVGAPSCH